MSFFDAADEVERQRAAASSGGSGWQQYRRPAEPEWQRVPTEFVPQLLPLSVLLERRARVALTLTEVEVYPTGFQFSVSAIRHPEPSDDDHDEHADFGTFMNHHRGADRFRLGLDFGGGVQATNDWPGGGGSRGQAPDAVLRSLGGGGSGDAMEARFWAWPIPADGDIDVVYAWPICGLDEARFTISGDELRRAAAACEAIWPDLPSDGPDPSHAPDLPSDGPGAA